MILILIKKHKKIFGIIIGFFAISIIAPIYVWDKTEGSKIKKISCEELFGIKTPPSYIQELSKRECFYPLIYTFSPRRTIASENHFSNIYYKGFVLNIGNLSFDKLNDKPYLQISTEQNNRIIFTCHSDEYNEFDSNMVKSIYSLPSEKQIYCAFLIESSSPNIANPKITIGNSQFHAEYVPTNIWQYTGFNLYLEDETNIKIRDENETIFKPLNDYIHTNTSIREYLL